jgi:hypothetical protein
MRSVVVVFPASMCAMIPTLRTFSVANALWLLAAPPVDSRRRGSGLHRGAGGLLAVHRQGSDLIREGVGRI